MPYNRRIYNIQWFQYAFEMLPVKWRFAGAIVWVRTMAVTWHDLYSRFTAFRMTVKYNLLITPQVCYLEKALNDRYDVVQRRLFISDAPEYLPISLFKKVEGKKIVLKRKAEDSPKVLYTKAETAQYSQDFIVNIPIGVTYDLAELRAFVDGYKLATKTYKVKLF